MADIKQVDVSELRCPKCRHQLGQHEANEDFSRCNALRDTFKRCRCDLTPWEILLHHYAIATGDTNG